jgi:c-di-AMP phosphodiesterase-like protein
MDGENVEQLRITAKNSILFSIFISILLIVVSFIINPIIGVISIFVCLIVAILINNKKVRHFELFQFAHSGHTNRFKEKNNEKYMRHPIQRRTYDRSLYA